MDDVSTGVSSSLWAEKVVLECLQGHLAKNPNTKRFKALEDLPRHHCLILTGTPVQNNLKVRNATCCHPIGLHPLGCPLTSLPRPYPFSGAVGAVPPLLPPPARGLARVRNLITAFRTCEDSSSSFPPHTRVSASTAIGSFAPGQSRTGTKGWCGVRGCGFRFRHQFEHAVTDGRASRATAVQRACWDRAAEVGWDRGGDGDGDA